MNLQLDWCSHDAAKYAVEHWHYSKCLPAGKIVKVGVWEYGIFIGCVLFSRGASPTLLKHYNLTQLDGCELTRVALNSHDAPVSKIVAIAIKMLKSYNTKLRLIVSFADTEQGHIGGIYQAGNWVYSGMSQTDNQYMIGGKWVHPRSVGSLYGTRSKSFIDKMGFKTREGSQKHRYLYPLDKKMRKQIELLRQPYPKNIATEVSKAMRSAHQQREGGSIPTQSLKLSVANA